MRREIVAAFAVVLSGANAFAADTNGAAALALAGVVGAQDPSLSAGARHRLARLFDGHLAGGGPISVRAASIQCRFSDVAIETRSCALVFGAHHRALTGRSANELFATMAGAGVPGDGAAGSIFESLTKLDCVVTPAQIAAQDGSGAKCAYAAGP